MIHYKDDLLARLLATTLDLTELVEALNTGKARQSDINTKLRVIKRRLPTLSTGAMAEIAHKGRFRILTTAHFNKEEDDNENS